jgi:hypothetical protein
MNNGSGAVTCARYAFAPNFYNYCGPDTGVNFGEYVARSEADGKLVEYISSFETLYPYLVSIAHANNITDPLDERVIEAYWVGNLLLNKVRPQETFSALAEGQQLNKRLGQKELKWLYPKIDQRARLHHSFHVFNIFTRTGHRTVAHTVDTMDQCRIGWGQVINQKIEVRSQKLEYKDGKLQFVKGVRQVVNPIEGLKLKEGDRVSFHWGFVCEKLSETQVKWLSKLTQYHLNLANQTL